MWCTGIQGISALVLGRGPLAKVGLSAKFCVVVFKASLLWYLGGGGSIGQSRFICQILCSGIQGISTLVPGGSIGQSRVICHVLCSGMQVISALVLGSPLVTLGLSVEFGILVFKASLLWYCGGPLARLGLFAKFGVLVFTASLLWYWGGGSIGQSRFVCQVLFSGMQVISALVLGSPLVTLGLSVKFGILVFKASLLWYLRGSLAKVGSSANFSVVVCRSSLLWYWGMHWTE